MIFLLFSSAMISCIVVIESRTQRNQTLAILMILSMLVCFGGSLVYIMKITIDVSP